VTAKIASAVFFNDLARHAREFVVSGSSDDMVLPQNDTSVPVDELDVGCHGGSPRHVIEEESSCPADLSDFRDGFVLCGI
jgi:hypothetical protein